MSELIVEAKKTELDRIFSFIRQELPPQCSPSLRLQVEMAAEEIFANISDYAYAGKTGKMILNLELQKTPLRLILKFQDEGIPYNPLEKEEPDLTLDAEHRPVGGLGIYLVRSYADSLEYEYKDGKNILIFMKKIE